MRIIQEHPSHYVLGLDNGQQMTVAKTPGTMKMIGQHVTPSQGLAGGGEVAQSPEVQRALAELAANQAKLDQLAAQGALSSAPEAVGPAPVVPVGTPVGGAMPPVQTGMGGESDSQPSTADALQMATNPAAAAVAQKRTGMTHMPGDADIANQLPTEPPPQAMPGRPQLDPAPYSEYAALLPGMREKFGGDVSALAKQQADSQERLAEHYRSREREMQTLGPMPSAPPIDPHAPYRNIGKALGADGDFKQRLIGGIAVGLVSGLGELGGALSHRENAAGKMIQGAIQQSIQTQNANNQLSRQQWVDQTNYMTDMANNKILQLSAEAKAPEIKLQAQVLIDQINLAATQAMAEKGLMKPEQAEKYGKMMQALSALDEYEAGMSGSAQGAGATWEEVTHASGFSGMTPAMVARTQAQYVRSPFLKAKLAAAMWATVAGPPPGETGPRGEMSNAVDSMFKNTPVPNPNNLADRDRTQIATWRSLIIKSANMLRKDVVGMDSRPQAGVGKGAPPGMVPAP